MRGNNDQMSKLSGFKGVGDLAKAYIDTIGRSTVPGQNSKPEEVEAFYRSLGKPLTAAGYSCAKSNPTFAEEAFKANLTDAQVKTLLEADASFLNQQQQVQSQVLLSEAQNTETALKKEYGDKYPEALAALERGLGNNSAKKEVSQIAQALTSAGLIYKPEIVEAFIAYGRKQLETLSPGGGSPSNGSGYPGQGGLKYKSQEEYKKQFEEHR
jgi:hypothetical protein